jgi:branched-chain amino acid aminotransferase
MIVYLDGQWMPADQARVSIFDRSFLYGDGLFETMRVYGGRFLLWREHWDRFTHGTEVLGIACPEAETRVLEIARESLDRNQLPDAVVRLHLSRGVGKRGYSPRGADRPTFIITTHPAPALEEAAPAAWHLRTASIRLPAHDPLAAFKSANKLIQVLARAEADSFGADDALLLNQHGHLAEASSANLFWFSDDHLCTPPLSDGALPGVTREFLLRQLRRAGWACSEVSRGPEALVAAHGVFLTVSGLGVVEVGALDGRVYQPSARVREVRQKYFEAVRSELSD